MDDQELLIDDQELLKRKLKRARRALLSLEEEKAGYKISVPEDLQSELEKTQNEVKSLEALLSQLQGKRTVPVLDSLLRYNDVFVGRKAEIDLCLEALSPEERGWGVAIDGIGGMGKTALALEVAHEARKKAMLFDAYLFASAQTTRLSAERVSQQTLALSSLDRFVQEFATALAIKDIVKMTDATERRRALLNALRGRRVLMIWDNLETLNPEERDMIAEFLRKLPTPNKAIITSRPRTEPSALIIRLDRLSEAEALELMRAKGQLHRPLAQKLNETKPEILTDLYEAADGNPLALDWTLGQVVHKGHSVSFALKRLQNPGNSKDLYDFLFADVAQTLSENARAVLYALAIFQIPATTAALADATDLSLTQIQVAVEQLVTLSLVNDLDGERFGLHFLTRTYFRATLGKKDTVETRLIDDFNLQPQQANRESNPQVMQLKQEVDLEKDESSTHQQAESKQKEVFISYTLRDNHSELFVQKLEKAFKAKGITLIRDKNATVYRQRFKKFMQRLSRGKCVIVVISHEYLKSENCMYELVEIAKNGNIEKRIFPIVLADAKIYETLESIEYIKYWEKQIQDLNQAMKTVSSANLERFHAAINLYTEIRQMLDNLLILLEDMNALTADIHLKSNFEALLQSITKSLDE